MTRLGNIVVCVVLLVAPYSLAQTQEQQRAEKGMLTAPTQQSAQTPVQGENQKTAIQPSSVNSVQEQGPAQVVYSEVESVVEAGVQVVRRTRAGQGSARPQQADHATGADAVPWPPMPARTSEAKPYPLVRVRMVDNWKYAKPQRTAETQRAQLWEYKERRHQTYRPRPERSHEEVERLTKYRRTQD